MEISESLYNWLVEIQILASKSGSRKAPNTTLLNSKATRHFANGLLLIPIIKHLNSKNKPSRGALSELDSLQDASSTVVRLHNWKILSTVLCSLDVPLDPDTRALILAGDTDQITDLLERIRLKMNAESPNVPNRQLESFISTIDYSKSLSSAQSCLEFLLLSFSTHFKLKPKQAAGLLTQGGKYLAHVVSKGLRGGHCEVVAWYQDIYANIKHLVRLVVKEEADGAPELILSSFKAGFSSKHIETASWCCRLYAKLAAEFIDKDLLTVAWDWFIAAAGGCAGCLLSYNRYGPDIKSSVVSVIVQFSKNHFFELFSLQLRTQLPGAMQYFAAINEFLPALCQIRTAKQELMTAEIVGFWVDLGLREADNEAAGVRLAAINFICDIWVYLPNAIELYEELARGILGALKRGCRDRNGLMQYACFGKLFHLLDVFIEEKNSYAPILYKTLTFALVEHYDDSVMREFILSNFLATLRTEMSIPVTIVLEPFMKQLQVSESLDLNVRDFEFLLEVGKHPRLTLKNGIQLLDILGKIYSNELEFCSIAAVPLLIISARFIDSRPVQEYLFKYSKYSIKLCYALANKEGDRTGKDRFLFEMYQSQAMLDMVHNIIELGNTQLNEKIKNEAICTVHSLDKLRKPTQPLLSLLALYGDPDSILAEHEKPPESPQNIPKRSSNQSSNHSLRSSLVAPRGRAAHYIEKVRQTRVDQEFEKRLQQEMEIHKQEKRKRVLKKQLEQRKIQEAPRTLQVFTNYEKEGIAIVLKRYARVLKLLFKKYSGAHRVSSEPDINVISVSDIFKLLKEQGVSRIMLTQEELAGVLKAYSLNRAQPTISFIEFTEVLVHLALLVYSKPPRDLDLTSPAIALKTLFEHFRNCSADKGISTTFYDEPDPGFGVREVVKRLNRQLEKDPECALPEGYKRVEDNEVQVQHKVPPLLALPEGLTISLEILDELLSSIFEFHILEPVVLHKTVFRAKGALQRPRVSSKSKTVNTPSTHNEKPINYAVQRKIEREQQEKQDEQHKEQQRKLRKQVVQKQLKKTREGRINQILQDSKRDTAEHRRELEIQRVSSKKRDKEQAKKAEELRKWRDDKEKERVEQAEAEKRRKLRESKEKREKSGVTAKRESEKLEQMIREKTEQGQLRLRSEEAKEQNKKKLPSSVLKRIAEDKQKAAEDRRKEEELQSLLASGPVQGVLAEYQVAVETVFQNYSKLSSLSSSSLLDFTGFNRFATQLGVWPGLLKSSNVMLIYRNITKRTGSQGLSSVNFQEALFRVSVQARGELEKTGEALDSHDNGLRALFKWLKLSTRKKEVLGLLHSLNNAHSNTDPKQTMKRTQSKKALAGVRLPHLNRNSPKVTKVMNRSLIK